MTNVESGGYEYRLLDAGGWELQRMHRELERLSGQGWEIDAAYGPEETADPGVGLHLWLRRPSIGEPEYGELDWTLLAEPRVQSRATSGIAAQSRKVGEASAEPRAQSRAASSIAASREEI